MALAASVLTKRDRRHNDRTGDLDVAIRHLNRAMDYEARGQTSLDKHYSAAAVEVLKRIGPELLTIDPEAA